MTPQTQTLEELLHTYGEKYLEYADLGRKRNVKGMFEDAEELNEIAAQISATMIPRTEHERELVQARISEAAWWTRNYQDPTFKELLEKRLAAHKRKKEQEINE